MKPTEPTASLFTAQKMNHSNGSGSALTEALGQYKRALYVLFMLSLPVNLLVLASPLYMIQLFDRVLSSGSRETLISLTIITSLALALYGFFEILRSRLLIRCGLWLSDVLSGHFVIAGVKATLAGSTDANKPLQDLETLKKHVCGNAPKTISDALWSPLFYLALWFLHPLIGLIGILFALLLLCIAVLNDLATRKPARLAADTASISTRQLEELCNNADAVTAMGMTTRFIQQWGINNRQLIARAQRVQDINADFTGLSRFLRLLAQMAVLAAGAWLVLANTLTPGGMIAGSILLSRALAPVDQAIAAWKSHQSARYAKQRLQLHAQYLETPQEKLALPAPTGNISVRNLTVFNKDRSATVLTNISFDAVAGDTIGIIGPSSSSKSTLCRALLGAVPGYQGSICHDGAELSQWDTENLGRFVGYLPQEIHFFSASVGSNIARLDPHANAEDIIQAARIAGAHDMILRLPQGYDTPLGTAGVPLSGGQRRRIALARALYREPPFIVLDEPNASLDAEGEIALLKALEYLRNSKSTVLVVTHQAKIIRLVDKVLMINAGKLEAYAPRDEVLINRAVTKTQKTSPDTAEHPDDAAATQRVASLSETLVDAVPGMTGVAP